MTLLEIREARRKTMLARTYTASPVEYAQLTDKLTRLNRAECALRARSTQEGDKE